MVILGISCYLKGYVLCRRLLSASRGCHLRGLVPPFWHPGGPWWQDGFEGVRHRIFIDFEVILGPNFESFLGTEA